MNYPTDLTCADLEAIFAPVAFVKPAVAFVKPTVAFVKPDWMVEHEKEAAQREGEDWAIENEELLAEIEMEATGVGDGVR